MEKNELGRLQGDLPERLERGLEASRRVREKDEGEEGYGSSLFSEKCKLRNCHIWKYSFDSNFELCSVITHGHDIIRLQTILERYALNIIKIVPTAIRLN